MKQKITGAFFLLLVVSMSALAQSSITSIDLQPQWRYFDQSTGEYIPYNNNLEADALYILLDANQYGRQNLVLESVRECAVFVNTQLFYTGKTLNVRVDSLATVFRSPLLTIAIVQPKVGLGLQTRIQGPVGKDATESEFVRNVFMRDFAVSGALILIVMLVVLIQLNPKLASDYFSVTRIFSNRESNDVQVQSRISSSTNILFYFFCSLLIAFCLLLVFNFVSGHYTVALSFQSNDFGTTFFNWFKLSALVLVVFFAKIILIYGISSIFQVQGVSGMYFFNWIRVLLLATGTVAIVLFVYFIRYGNNENFFRILFEVMPWMLVGWMILIAFKLRQKLNTSMFHLFSYICATELIPFLITIKVLFS